MDKLVNIIKQNKVKNISFLLGAGASTSAGIPDFRSESGLYNKIKTKMGLEKPENLFDITYFKQNPEKFYYYVKHISTAEYDKYNPTVTHKFIKIIENKNMLNLVYTQNIDSLEIKAGVSEHKVIQAHGHRRRAKCTGCKKEYPIEHFFTHVHSEKVMYCEHCNQPCKTCVVFFGERLAESYYDNKDKLLESDLIFVIGTSLVVKPFGYLINHFKNTYKILINREDLLTKNKTLNKDDDMIINFVGESDLIVKEIVDQLGWSEELKYMG